MIQLKSEKLYLTFVSTVGALRDNCYQIRVDVLIEHRPITQHSALRVHALDGILRYHVRYTLVLGREHQLPNLMGDEVLRCAVRKRVARQHPGGLIHSEDVSVGSSRSGDSASVLGKYVYALLVVEQNDAAQKVVGRRVKQQRLFHFVVKLGQTTKQFTVYWIEGENDAVTSVLQVIDYIVGQ